MNKELLEEIIASDDTGLLRDSYTTNLERFRQLIQAQDLVRSVMCSESGEIYLQLKKIDKDLSKAINHYGKPIGSVTNQI